MEPEPCAGVSGADCGRAVLSAGLLAMMALAILIRHFQFKYQEQ